MSVLPDNWIEVEFDELNEFTSRNVNPADVLNEKFELYSVPSFPTRKPEIVLGSEIGSPKQIVRENDVLVCKINPKINRVWQVGKANGLRQIASSEWIVFRSSRLKPSYLRYYFSSYGFREMLCRDLTGVGGSLTRAQPKRVAKLPLPLAPVNEQERIAAKLDSLLAAVDACRARLEKVPELIKRFRQSVLAAATSGALTEVWRESLAGSAEWVDTQIQEIASVGTGSTPLRSNEIFFTNGTIPWITSAATSQELVTKADTFVTDAAVTAHRLKRYEIGTLLVAMYGEGKTRGQVCELGIVATINQACAAVKVDVSKALTKYVKFSLQSNYLQMRAMAEGGNQPNLNLSKVKEFPIHLPGMEEQAEIVRRVEVLFAIADKLEASLVTARKRVDQLTPAILVQAFRGELVAQDQNDEPASALLARTSSVATYKRTVKKAA